ncbi:hypothetical protein DIPPA_33967 [Diplonema papillatum]|nr:hypothetical protein DIPPA_33967 [Diplonema papillatum]
MKTDASPMDDHCTSALSGFPVSECVRGAAEAPCVMAGNDERSLDSQGLSLLSSVMDTEGESREDFSFGFVQPKAAERSFVANTPEVRKKRSRDDNCSPSTGGLSSSTAGAQLSPQTPSTDGKKTRVRTECITGVRINEVGRVVPISRTTARAPSVSSDSVNMPAVKRKDGVEIRTTPSAQLGPKVNLSRKLAFDDDMIAALEQLSIWKK